MADIKSNTPIYSRGTSDPVVISKDTSANALTNPVYTQLSDGSAAVSITGGSLDVNITGSTGSITVTASDLDIRDLSASQDNVALSDGTNELDFVVINSAYGATPVAMPVAGKYESSPTTYGDGDATHLQTDANGKLNVNAAFSAGAKIIITDGTDDLEINADGSINIGDISAGTQTNDISVTATDLDIRNLVHATDSVSIGDGTETLNITAAGEAEVNIAAQSLTALKISKDANANAENNPIYVYNVEGSVIGIEVISYDTSAAVASDASDNHDYTVIGSETFKVKRAFGSASGAQKIELQAGPVAALVTQAVAFTSQSNPNWVMEFDGLLEVPDTSTGTVRIIRRNDDNQAMDVYSTIIGTSI